MIPSGWGLAVHSRHYIHGTWTGDRSQTLPSAYHSSPHHAQGCALRFWPRGAIFMCRESFNRLYFPIKGAWQDLLVPRSRSLRKFCMKRQQCLGDLPGPPARWGPHLPSQATLPGLGFPALSAGRLHRDVIHGEALSPLQDEAGFK